MADTRSSDLDSAREVEALDGAVVVVVVVLVVVDEEEEVDEEDDEDELEQEVWLSPDTQGDEAEDESLLLGSGDEVRAIPSAMSAFSYER